MRPHSMRLPYLLILLPITAHAAAADVEELLRRSMRAVEENGIKGRQYAYRECKVTVLHDKNGKETNRETETSEVIGLEGATYKKLVMRNDRPLSAKEQKREDEKLRAEQRRRQEENAGKRPHRVFSLTYSFSLPYDRVPVIYNLKLLGADEILGHPTTVVGATPNADFHPTTDDEKEALNYTLKLWLDDADAFPLRIEAEITGEHSRMQKGSRFRQENIRVDDAWLPRELTFEFAARIVKLFSLKGTATYTFTDYHKFQVESNVQFLDKR